MKRRNFIISASVAAVSVPAAYYFEKHKLHGDSLYVPEMLSRFCEELVLKEIGLKYRKLVPTENDRKKLMNLLLTSSDGKILRASDNSAVGELLDKKIIDEFTAYNIITINGWVITITEARQCALFSLT